MITVKLLSSRPVDEWRRYFPHEDCAWGACRFVFAREARDYDWLVVYDDVPPAAEGGRDDACERLACPRARTVLVTTEPESIKCYGRAFAAQFGHVLTSQPPWALPHPHHHWQQAANHWFYGSAPDACLDYAQMQAGPDWAEKRERLSVVHSQKCQWHTLHARRFAFIETVRRALPEMAVYGRGWQPLGDKREALAPFRYHLAVENHVAPHHITEKLTDAFLGRCLPFYAGAPNAADYFPAESFIAIDLYRPRQAVDIIREAIASGQWEKRREAIEAARERVLQHEHLFAVLERLVRTHPDDGTQAGAGEALWGRHAWRRRHPVGALAHMGEKLYVRARSMLARGAKALR